MDTEILSKIEHTLLKPDARKEDMTRICAEAVEYGFGLVAINPCWTGYCKERLKGTGILVDAAVGFPLGQSLRETKAAECKHCIDAGADEIDMVMNVGKFIDGDEDYVFKDIKGVVDCCHRFRRLCKVILETCLLSKARIIQACKIAEKAGADFVKTSTGFSGPGATAENVALMRASVGPGVKIKASGGIRNLEQAMAMVCAGADRIGTSAGIVIARELRR
ncbi:MAG: deoxyribose-phosphate aldolase [Treponema sp.]|jgi:deoxyribose-phosphate aldolase|nr:deoxyribose-phosphate aldolase [Treponema sp.]